MAMDVLAACAAAQSDPSVRKLQGYFLASAFSLIEDKQEVRDWTLLFFNPLRMTTIDCAVNERGIVLEEPRVAQKKFVELRPGDDIMPADHAVVAMRGRITTPIVNILLSLHREDRLLWNVTFITIDFMAHSFELDAVSGQLLKETEASLVRREK